MTATKRKAVRAVPAIETPWLTTDEAAAYMKRAPYTVRKWRLEGKGPRFYKQGKGTHAPVVYFRPDLDEFIRAEGARFSTSDLSAEDRAATATH
jgi:hypothetical protein